MNGIIAYLGSFCLFLFWFFGKLQRVGFSEYTFDFAFGVWSLGIKVEFG